MERRVKYGRFVIDPRSYELRDGNGWTSEFSLEEHDGRGVTDTVFHLRETFPTREEAIEAAIQAGRNKIASGLQTVS